MNTGIKETKAAEALVFLIFPINEISD